MYSNWKSIGEEPFLVPCETCKLKEARYFHTEPKEDSSPKPKFGTDPITYICIDITILARHERSMSCLQYKTLLKSNWLWAGDRIKDLWICSIMYRLVYAIILQIYESAWSACIEICYGDEENFDWYLANLTFLLLTPSIFLQSFIGYIIRYRKYCTERRKNNNKQANFTIPTTSYLPT